ncbi:MAG: SMC-Scp complex subunit ScpB, partial [Planctomycetaceae bacterium]|nr:SMC-Scp complex subunit ScpB [Planctomycetaceae bacterium]
IIRLREGGFRMELREEFGDIRMKVFGLGPREVRLSPEALEILAFIAYNQPVSRQALSEVRKSNTSTVVRQLLRLNLVELDRPEAKKSDVTYRTGNRFLRLFDLDTLEDLPNADIFRFK